MGAGSGISLTILIGYIKGYSKVEERTEEVGSYVPLYTCTLPCTSESYPYLVRVGLVSRARLVRRVLGRG